MAREVDAGLKARGYVAPISYGPRRLERGLPAVTEIVVERDRERSDLVTSPTGAHKQPHAKAPVVLRRDQRVRATVYAHSTLSGALIEDHERLCDALVDALLTELAAWLSEAQAGNLAVDEARYLGARDFEGAAFDQWPGAAYVIRFSVPRGVRRVDFAGEGAETAKPAGVQNATNARLNTGGAATGCDSTT